MDQEQLLSQVRIFRAQVLEAQAKARQFAEAWDKKFGEMEEKRKLVEKEIADVRAENEGYKQRIEVVAQLETNLEAANRTIRALEQKNADLEASLPGVYQEGKQAGIKEVDIIARDEVKSFAHEIERMLLRSGTDVAATIKIVTHYELAASVVQAVAEYMTADAREADWEESAARCLKIGHQVMLLWRAVQR